MTLDTVDRGILDRIQREFPIVERPFLALGEELGLSEQETLRRVAALQDAGYIRELGAVFDLKKLGYTSTLCAAKVSPEAIEAATAKINAFDEVTHNYLREHAFNIWFTVIAPSVERIEAILDEIRQVPGVHSVLSMPSKKTFKIRVQFNTSGDAS